ncbi:MAG: hypothetical protein JW995_01345 [Melioribacteraceae bacterium]|nr:hypothetical protein [Melioribacteraceae bacterium]
MGLSLIVYQALLYFFIATVIIVIVSYLSNKIKRNKIRMDENNKPRNHMASITTQIDSKHQSYNSEESKRQESFNHNFRQMQRRISRHEHLTGNTELSSELRFPQSHFHLYHQNNNADLKINDSNPISFR